MSDNNKQTNVQETAQNALRKNRPQAQGRQFLLWFGALILGGILGWLGIQPLNDFLILLLLYLPDCSNSLLYQLSL